MRARETAEGNGSPMFVYELASPIDYWEGMVTLGQYIACNRGWPDLVFDSPVGREFDEVLRFLFAAMDHARQHGDWDGDAARV
jgi:hypothetical protein